MIYQHADIAMMQETAENINEHMTLDANKSDFWRVGIEIYIGTFTDVSGPSFIIDPNDTEGIAIFREFAARMAAHYKTLKNKS